MSDRPPPAADACHAGAAPEPDRLITAGELSKLKWRCRRGLLENDIFLERFFERFESALTLRQAQALGRLMELGDNDLLDLLLKRRAPQGDINTSEVIQVLEMLRTRGASPDVVQGKL
ncbi:succinate dehydrogenase assembly factor 2 [Ramlibacter sp.]|uniref:FAD assembly factor SdhE n=1 Tax=Ramlibacter sp. TaxID=1917967 RepID=UPI002CBF4652|nr:succinate dehydrogenase assembly factor 2 [Ramlibacter sp.]HWI81376.1 succinate dehydrogenase assembly factor 2 [Ramlibacter sp.]